MGVDPTSLLSCCQFAFGRMVLNESECCAKLSSRVDKCHESRPRSALMADVFKGN